MSDDLNHFLRWLLDRDTHGEINGNRMTINLEIEVDAHEDSLEGRVDAVITEYRKETK